MVCVKRGFSVSTSVLLVAILWAATCLAVAALSGMFRPRHLPSTRHARRIRTLP
jgi:hypothetical protein